MEKVLKMNQLEKESGHSKSKQALLLIIKPAWWLGKWCFGWKPFFAHRILCFYRRTLLVYLVYLAHARTVQKMQHCSKILKHIISFGLNTRPMGTSIVQSLATRSHFTIFLFAICFVHKKIVPKPLNKKTLLKHPKNRVKKRWTKYSQNIPQKLS